MTMKYTSIFSWILLPLAGLLIMSFHNKKGFEIPLSKIDTEVVRLMNTKTSQLVELTKPVPGFEGASLFSIEQEGYPMGFVLVNRVESCRAGGCDASISIDQQPFEFFDYFMILSLQGEVLRVRIFNYQATRGHEVMSKGWLRQFVGIRPHQELTVGDEIQAISGATISARAITADIVSQTTSLGDYLSDPLSQR